MGIPYVDKMAVYEDKRGDFEGDEVEERNRRVRLGDLRLR
jgi:hypothetical protein